MYICSSADHFVVFVTGVGPSTSAAAPATASSGPGAPVSRQKQGKVVFAGGNRLAAKQAASKEQKVACHCFRVLRCAYDPLFVVILRTN